MAAPGAMGTLLGSNGQSTEFDIQAWWSAIRPKPGVAEGGALPANLS
jgi:hypothetical protein